MNSEQIKKEIDILLDTIAEQANAINEYEQNIPQIELDIVLENIRKLYQAYIFLDAKNKKPKFEEEIRTAAIEPPADLPEAPTPIKFEEQIQAPEMTKLEEQTVTENTATEIEPDFTTEKNGGSIPQQEKIIIKETPAVKKSPDLFTEPVTMSDKFKSDTKSINEKISQTLIDKTLASKIKKTPISDLKTAIGINEKFRFIHDLFDGELADYNDAISKLNSFNGIEEAAKYLEDLMNMKKWNSESPAFVLLSELISRRYVS